jgi:hypothetical protein
MSFVEWSTEIDIVIQNKERLLEIKKNFIRVDIGLEAHIFVSIIRGNLHFIT